MIQVYEPQVTQYDNYNAFETKYFRFQYPKNWKTYVEPIVKEQLRHSPTNDKGEIIQNEYIKVSVFNNANPQASLKKKIDQNIYRKFFGNDLEKVKHEVFKGSDNLGQYVLVENYYMNVKDNKRSKSRTYYYAYPKTTLIVFYFFSDDSTYIKDYESIKESLKLKI